MGMMEGILKGVGSAFKETKARMDEENQRQAMLESRVYEALLASDYPDVQELALQGMTEIASGKGGKKKGLMGFLGKDQPSPILASMGELFSGGRSVQAPKGAPTGETPAGVPFGEVGPPSAAMLPESAIEPGAQPPRGLYIPEAEKAGMMTTAQLEARTEHLRSLGASDEDIKAALTGRQAATPGVDYQTVVGPEGRPVIVALDDRTGQPMGIVGEAPSDTKAPGRPMSIRGKGGTYLLDPDTLDQIGFIPGEAPKPGEDPNFTRAKRTQRALESHIKSLGFGFTTLTDEERAAFLDEFVQKYGGFVNHGEYLSHLSGGGVGGVPPSAGGFDINQIPEQYRRFMEPSTGAPSQEAEQRIQGIIEKLRAYKADPESNPPLDPHEVEFAQFYQQYFLGRK